MCDTLTWGWLLPDPLSSQPVEGWGSAQHQSGPTQGGSDWLHLGSPLAPHLPTCLLLEVVGAGTAPPPGRVSQGKACPHAPDSDDQDQRGAFGPAPPGGSTPTMFAPWLPVPWMCLKPSPKLYPEGCGPPHRAQHSLPGRRCSAALPKGVQSHPYTKRVFAKNARPPSSNT